MTEKDDARGKLVYDESLAGCSKGKETPSRLSIPLTNRFAPTMLQHVGCHGQSETKRHYLRVVPGPLGRKCASL